MSRLLCSYCFTNNSFAILDVADAALNQFGMGVVPEGVIPEFDDAAATRVVEKMNDRFRRIGGVQGSTLEHRAASLAPHVVRTLVTRGVEPDWHPNEHEYANDYHGHASTMALARAEKLPHKPVPYQTKIYGDDRTVREYRPSVLQTLNHVTCMCCIVQVGGADLRRRRHLVEGRCVQEPERSN